MSEPKLDTRWHTGPRDFSGVASRLPGDLTGLQILPLQLEPDSPEERGLFVIDRGLSRKAFAGLGGLRIDLRGAALDTRGGALGALALPLLSPADDEPLAVYAFFFDPGREDVLATLDALAAQSHWHVFVLGRGRETLGVFEFENVFDLAARAATLRAGARAAPLSDEAAALAHVADVDVVDLWRLMGAEVQTVPLALPQLGPTPELFVLAASRAEVEAGDPSAVAAVLRDLGRDPAVARERRATVDLALDGWEHDPRPLWQNEAARRWFRALVLEVPDVMFWLAPVSGVPRVVLLCTVPLTVEQGGMRIQSQDVHDFLAWALRSLDLGLERAGLDLDSPSARRHRDALLAALPQPQAGPRP